MTGKIIEFLRPNKEKVFLTLLLPFIWFGNKHVV
jgi:hypothetical protein